MLLIAIAILAVAWVGVAIILVGLCASAAAGDRPVVRTTEPAPAAQAEPGRLLRIA